MTASPGELIVLVRICGSTFAVRRDGPRLRYRRMGAAPRVRLPDQTGALALLRKE